MAGSSTSRSEIWDVDYVNEEHVEAFAQALSRSDHLPTEGDNSPASPRSPPLTLNPEGLEGKSPPPPTWKYGPDNGSLSSGRAERMRVEKLAATSDFAPIHQRVSRRRTRSSNQGLTYHLMRWPLLSFFFLIIWLEFSAYVITRQVVNVFEWLVAWRGYKRKLRTKLRDAQTYEEWTKAAKELDEHLGFDEWKETEEDGYFDYTLVKRVKRTLTRLRGAKDTRGLMDALAVCVRTNFAGTEGPKMYSETFFGTKYLVEAHIMEVATSLDFVRTATDVSMEEKRAFFRAVNKNYGSSALCLSGGASFGYYHFGVVKAFLEADLLPRVITGTSAGGLVAALLCTRTNAELRDLLVPELADKITACSDPIKVWLKRWRETGARFSAVEWARKSMFFTRGSLTFKEAYQRTGRALNVSVVPADRHSPTILLNHLTAPNCLIWSAIIASAAVPGILNPVVLMAKDRNGNLTPHNLGGSRFKDGSLREDIPLGSLHTQFNCNFSIVSQTNPHIHLFFFAPRGSVGRPVAHRKGKGWRGGFILSALESYIKLDLNKHFKVIRDLDLLPQILQSDWSGVFLQRFSGDLTLTPRSTVTDWFRLLSDPTPPQLERMLWVGQRVSWPALRMVQNRLLIERAILRGRAEVRTSMQRERTTTDQDARRLEREAQSAAESQVPIESDADAGFASRSRRIKAVKDRGLSARDIFTDSGDGPRAGTTRRRKAGNAVASGSARRTSTSTSDNIIHPPDTSPLPRHNSQDSPASRSYATSLSDTFRHIRASSLSAFAPSPFRSVRFGSDQEIPPSPIQPPTPANHSSQRRSNLSISRWFGGASESSSDSGDGEEDPDREGPSPILGSNSLSGDDDLETTFVLDPEEIQGSGLEDSAVLDDSDESGDEEGVNGSGVIVEADDALLLGNGLRGRGQEYSPPQQDMED